MPLNLALFKNPPKIYRGLPFYSLNDLLDPFEVKRQIALLDEAGFGGVFFHAREGLITPFLSNEWFSVFKAALEEAKKRDMTVWIYDEDRWPSGFASGLVSAESSKYRPRAILLIIDNKAYSSEDILAVFKCVHDENYLPVKCERIERSESSSEYIYLNFTKYTATIGDPWFSGFSYIDLLNREAVKRFIEVAYKPYVEIFKDDIGKNIPGVFTDEPNIHDSRPRFPSWLKRLTLPPRGMRLPLYALTWTDSFPELFMKLNGYSIIEKLPELFFNIGDYVKTRYDYWKTITLLFVESFTKQIYEWCDKYKLMFTGHFLLEDDLISQLVVGSVMPHYEYMHIPGIDHLGLQIWGSLLTAKQVSSIANQLGKKRVLCEIYGCTGNYATFEDRKWIGDFLTALGVNLLNHHLVPYSLRGRRKADYGLNIHWAQPWWSFNKYIEDYYARLSYLLSEGIRVVDVLVVHPMYSVWSTYTPVNETTAREVNKRYFDLLRELIKYHIDFELGDEIIIEKYGYVRGKVFIVGRAEYRYVILPLMINIGRKTLELLKEFTMNGGVVIAVEKLPEYVEGVRENISKELNVILVRDFSELRNVLSKLDLTIEVKSNDVEGNILLHARRIDEDLILFMVNVSRSNTYEVEVGFKGYYRVEDWNLFTGDVLEEPCEYRDGKTWIKIKLLPVSSKLYVLRPIREPVIPATMRKPVLEFKRSVKLGDKWTITSRGLNYLVLDYARVFIREESSWSDLMPLPRIKDEYLATNIGSMFKLKFEFHVEDLPSSDLELIVEKTGSLKKISVNGVELDLERYNGVWIDPVFKVYKIPSGVIRRGVNEILIEISASLEPELEPFYIRGDFSVELRNNNREPFIVKPVSEVRGEQVDLTKSGYPFYSGSVVLSTEFYVEKSLGERVVLVVRDLSAALAVIKVNGKECGLIVNSYSETDITRCIVSGVNRLEIELISTLRNTLGPLHREDPVWTGPETFYTIDHTWRDSYVVRPLGFSEVRIDYYVERCV